MGSSKSKNKQQDEMDMEEFVRTADHEQLSRAIHSKVHDEGERIVSKKETLKIFQIQKEQMTEIVDQLESQMRNDELAGRRFVALQKQDLAGLALKKRVLHAKLADEVVKCVERHTEIEKQLRGNKQLTSSISKSLMKASKAIRSAETELKDDYIRQCRRPGFDFDHVNNQFHMAGITHDDIIGDLNALWMDGLEESLAEDEEAMAKLEEEALAKEEEALAKEKAEESRA